MKPIKQEIYIPVILGVHLIIWAIDLYFYDGNFKLKSITGEKQIWIAGGIGITPFLSIAQEKTNKQIKLFWCVNDIQEAVYYDELLAISQRNKNFEIVVWCFYEKGFLTIEDMGISDFKSCDYLICGPQSLNFVK